jgi:hypothetical protein
MKRFTPVLIASVLGAIIAISVIIVIGPGVPVQSNDNTAPPLPKTSVLAPAQLEEESSVNSSSDTSRPESRMSEITRPQEQRLPERKELSENTTKTPLAFSTFNNSSLGVEIQYPSNWQVIDGRNDNDGVLEIAGFISGFEDRVDRYKDRLWVSLDTLPNQNMSLKEYSEEVIKQYGDSLQDFTLLDNDTDSAILAGHPAYRLVYTNTLENDIPLKQMEIGTKVGEKIYFLTYYAEVEKYHDFLPVIQEMINSFEIEQ